MKILIVLILLLVSGCSKNTLYDEYLKEVKEVSKFSEALPFDIKISEDEIADEIMYQIVIDNPKREIKDLRCLGYNNQGKEMFPNIGLFEKAYTLVKYEVDSSKNRVKGISLVGYYEKTDDEVEYRVICKYNQNQTIYYQYLTS